jgi:hypothetical protein
MLRDMSAPDLRYPIGRASGEKITPENRKRILLDIADLPNRLRDALEALSGKQLDTPYRPEGWTVRQVVHHLADSHMHAYIRNRFTLTQIQPTIMAYDENAWAALKDAQTGPLEPSLLLLDGLHARWAMLLESLTEADWERPHHGTAQALGLVEGTSTRDSWNFCCRLLLSLFRHNRLRPRQRRAPFKARSCAFPHRNRSPVFR